MGQYLQVGICASVTIRKQDLLTQKLSYEEILIGMSSEIYMEAYDQVEYENAYGFILKDQIIQEGKLSEFLRDQYALIETKNGDEDEIIKLMDKQSSLNDIEQLLEDKGFYSFQNTAVFENIYLRKNQKALGSYSLLTFMREGKIMMEGYGDFLKYIEKNIKMSCKQPIGKVVKVMIG